MAQRPPSTRSRPNLLSSTSRCRMPLSSGMIAVCGPTAGANDLIASSRSKALQLSSTTSNFSVELVGLHRRRIFQRHVAVRALDHEAGAGQFGGAPRANQKGHVAAGLQHPAAEISADRAGADHENAHRLVPFVVALRGDASSEWRGSCYSLLAIRYRPLTTFPRTGEFPARTSRRCAAAGRAASRRRRPRPAASADPDCRALPCPRAARGARAPRRCRRRNR